MTHTAQNLAIAACIAVLVTTAWPDLAVWWGW